jgi:hypothetical protein
MSKRKLTVATKYVIEYSEPIKEEVINDVDDVLSIMDDFDDEGDGVGHYGEDSDVFEFTEEFLDFVIDELTLYGEGFYTKEEIDEKLEGTEFTPSTLLPILEEISETGTCEDGYYHILIYE